MKSLTFDMNLTTSITVDFDDVETAQKYLVEHMQVMDCNGGAWPDGSPILFEASLNERPTLAMIDGEDATTAAGDAPHGTIAALKIAEAFMAGFEGDDMQEGIADKLATVRAAIRSAAPPPGAVTVLRNALGAIDSLQTQVGQMSGMFDDEDGTIAEAVEAGEAATVEINAAIAAIESI